MANPFADWREDQQCSHVSACDSGGGSVEVNAPTACRWCAYGWMDRLKVDYDMQTGFCEYLEALYGKGVMAMNDDAHWTPAQFRDAWDRFEASRQ